MRAGVRPASIRAVLTGGASRMPGFDSLATTILGCPVRVGRPRSTPRAALDAMGPDLATAAGMLLVGMRTREKQAAPLTPSGTAGKLLTWLRQLF